MQHKTTSKLTTPKSAGLHTAIKLTTLGLALTQCLAVHAQISDDQHIQQEKDRTKAVQDQQPKAPDVRLEGQQGAEKPVHITLPLNEFPNFTIRHIELVGDSATKFQFALDKAIHQTGLMAITTQDGEHIIVTQANHQAAGQPSNEPIGVSLGAQGVNALMTAAQNAVIDRGYTTTRIMAEPQDLKSGILKLTVIPGRVRHIRFDTSNADKTHVSRAHNFNAIPIHEGDILNLRNIEMGLENLKRVPTVEADIKVAPADKANESDLIVTWAQKTLPLRGNITLDDTGGRSTGKYQGGATLSIDNPFTLNDLFYIGYGRDVQGYDTVTTTDENNNPTGTEHGKTHNWNLHYSLPYGYWQVAFNASGYNYNQAVAGANQTYHYSGHSRTQDLKLSRMMYRDAHRKTTAYIKSWTRYSDNYIDDTEIEVQRRKTAGLEFGLSHKEYIGNATLDFGISYKRGTGAKNARHAPEELFNEGTSRMKILSADIGLNLPFKINAQQFTFNTSNHMQWNKSPLLAQDKISIGGRSTVRGFDGNMSLSAERGWYSRNELAWTFLTSHQLYAAVDAGHVSGTSTQYLLGQTLIGGALGMRGEAALGGKLNYDVFIAKPIKKPSGFKTAKTTYGINLSYAF